MSEQVKKQIDIKKKYSFPEKLSYKKFDGKNLIIFTEGFLWLVFKNDEEVEIFDSLKNGLSIEQCLQRYNSNDVVSVVTQVEAKRFETPKIKKEERHSLFVYLTNNCNERCNHCYMYAGDIKFQQLTAEQWKKVLLDFKKAEGKEVTFSGGEITVYNGYEEVLKYAHSLGLNVYVLSNGILWDKEKVNELSSSIDRIQFSVDGYDRDSYKKIRNYDGFGAVNESIKLFANTNTIVEVSVTPLFDDLDNFLNNFEVYANNLLERHPNVQIRIAQELLDGRNLKVTEAKNYEYDKKTFALYEKLYPNVGIYDFRSKYEDATVRTNCNFGEIIIAPNGDVFWCNRIHNLKPAMNILTTSFDDIIKKSKETKTKTDVDHCIPCKECEIKYICAGNCRLLWKGIQDVETHKGIWEYKCPEKIKEYFFRLMIKSNNLFYEK